jgi:hypothetical protein
METSEWVIDNSGALMESLEQERKDSSIGGSSFNCGRIGDVKNGGHQGSLQSDFIGLRLGGSILAARSISGCVLVGGGVARRRLPCVDFLTGILLSVWVARLLDSITREGGVAGGVFERLENED